MNITIYIDVFFLWNLAIDYLILSIIVWIRKQKACRFRRFIGALTGSIASTIILILHEHINQVYMIICYVITALFILYITFRRTSKKQFIKNYLFFILTANCMAGILMSLGIFSDTSMLDLVKKYKYENESIFNKSILYMFFYVMSYVLPVLLFLWYKKKMPEEESSIYEVIIRYQEKDWHGFGFLDTGNLLFNPTNGRPVVLLDKKYFEELIGDGFMATEKTVLNLPGICVIPFHSAGKKNGILYGIKTTEMFLFQNGQKWHNCGVIAAYCEDLIPDDKGYQILLNSQLFA